MTSFPIRGFESCSFGIIKIPISWCLISFEWVRSRCGFGRIWFEVFSRDLGLSYLLIPYPTRSSEQAASIFATLAILKVTFAFRQKNCKKSKNIMQMRIMTDNFAFISPSSIALVQLDIRQLTLQKRSLLLFPPQMKSNFNYWMRYFACGLRCTAGN